MSGPCKNGGTCSDSTTAASAAPGPPPLSYAVQTYPFGPSPALPVEAELRWEGSGSYTDWLPIGFEFPFYRGRYSALRVDARGFIVFDGPGSDDGPDCCDTARRDGWRLPALGFAPALIAPCWAANETVFPAPGRRLPVVHAARAGPAAFVVSAVQAELEPAPGANATADAPGVVAPTRLWEMTLFADGAFTFRPGVSCPAGAIIGWQAAGGGRGYTVCEGTGSPEDDAECASVAAGELVRGLPDDGSIPLTEYRCECPRGWLGENCVIDEDECDSNPCQNGATCMESMSDPAIPIDRFTCICVPGFANGVCVYDYVMAYAAECSRRTGGVCDIDVDECVSSPCGNGATCLESGVTSIVPYHEYSCGCPAGFAGGLCPYDYIDEYEVECSIATGGNCDIDVNECSSSPCQHSSSCSDSTTSVRVSDHAYSCDCIEGYANGNCVYLFIAEFTAECTVMESDDGVVLNGNCDIDVDECSSSPCMNGGTCTESTVEATVSIHAYQCTCVAGFANGVCEYDFITEYTTECSVMESDDGPVLDGNCDIDVDECSSSPCVNGGTCTESTVEPTVSVHAYQCTCVAGFANGVCEYDFITEYTTECSVTESEEVASLSGNCDIDVDECSSSPCVNGGTCTESTVEPTVSVHAYQCTCVAGFANGVCEYDFITEYTTECSVTESEEVASLSGNCDIDVDECSSSPCVNGATCTESTAHAVSVHAYACTCVAGFAGGVCFSELPEYSALCNITVGGVCDVDIDECISDPCMNDAICTESNSSRDGGVHSVSVDGFSCNCTRGWSNGICSPGTISEYLSVASFCAVSEGGICDVDIDECVSNACQQQSVCTESNTSNLTVPIDAYSCACLPGWANGVCAANFLPAYKSSCAVLHSEYNATLGSGNCDVVSFHPG